MKVVKCLSKELSFKEMIEEVKAVFERGNKIAITLIEDDVFDFTENVVTSECEGVDLSGIKPEEIRDGIKVENGEIIGLKGVRMVFDSFVEDTAACYLEAKPFTKEGCEDGIVTFFFEGYDEGVSAIEEVEI